MVDVMRFLEIEHKFVVPANFDLASFTAVVDALHPLRRTALDVHDRYFLTRHGRQQRYVIRHRFDAELHQLTLKSFGDDPETRTEVSLDLGHHAGDQIAAVDAFLKPQEVEWHGTIEKTIRVWYFADCEVVHYVASTGTRTIACVEFEAVHAASVNEALSVLDRYERATGFSGMSRAMTSLVGLLFPGVLPED
jgi:hypothetical protein